MRATNEQVFIDQFNYHPPTPLHLARIDLVRSAVKELAAVLWRNLPDGPDKSAAIRLLRETMMTANAAIELGPGEIAPAFLRSEPE